MAFAVLRLTARSNFVGCLPASEASRRLAESSIRNRSQGTRLIAVVPNSVSLLRCTVYRYVYRGTGRREATFCPCQHREIVMRFIVLVLALLLTETSLSFAQGHMGTPQEQQACRRDAQRFCRQQLGDDGAVQQCLQQNRTRLSKSCQKVFASHGM